MERYPGSRRSSPIPCLEVTAKTRVAYLLVGVDPAGFRGCRSRGRQIHPRGRRAAPQARSISERIDLDGADLLRTICSVDSAFG